MKKLLIITDLFPDKYIPNGEVFLEHQANELAKSFEIRVIATRLKHMLSIEEDYKRGYQVTYIYIPYVKYVYITLIYTYHIYAIPIIKRVIKEWEPDIIHVHDFKHVPELFQLNYYLKQHNIPRYLSVHDLRTHPSMIKSLCFNWFYILTFRKAYAGWNYIFTVNDSMKKIISRDSKVSKISNIGNAISSVPAIPQEQIEPYRKLLSENSFKIISVGNLRLEKGFRILIKSVHMLAEKNYDIQVCIIGKGEEKARLISDINRLGLSGNFIFTGDISNDLVRNLYPLFDAFVLASYSETFGVVYIEAMDAGLPTVGVKGQGIDGVIKHGINGFLVNPQNADDLAEKIEYLINNREKVNEIALQGQKLIRNEYQLPQLIQKIMEKYV